jgi:hypothetical protein
MTLAWAGVQVTLVLVPAIVLHALASRRSAASGAWMALVGLALGLAVSVVALLPWPDPCTCLCLRRGMWPVTSPVAVKPTPASADGPRASRAGEVDRHGLSLSWSIAGLRDVVQRIELRAAAPAARLRPFAGGLALVALIGAGLGLGRLLLGLWAVRLCRRRGTIVDDPEVLALLDELRLAMGCTHPVELRVLHELTTPATAGWRHPVILLPEDWRSWPDADRRAILAHELAHIRRSDYAAGLVARLALVLNFYHPLVHWLAGRLQLQQELAADAVGARFAGGREAYLHTLASLALKQEARSSHWPLRTFLPARGTLIRRITMLQDESLRIDRPWSRPSRWLAGLGLLGLAVLVATLRAPVWADEGENRPTPSPAAAAPFDLQYTSDRMHGILAFRPAAIVRQPGLAFLARLFDETWIPALARDWDVDLAGPDHPELGLEDIEWVTASLNFGSGGRNERGEEVHRFMLGVPLALRTTKPFDWLRFLRGWHFEFIEAYEGDQVYYKITGVVQKHLGPGGCVYLPDERTLVCGDERTIRLFAGRREPSIPAYLTGADWDRVSRGLLAVAFQNRDGGLARTFNLDRPDDAVALSLLKGVDRWVFGLDDAESVVLCAAAACPGDASETIARVVESLVKRGRDALERSGPDASDDPTWTRARSLLKKLMANLRVGHDDHSVDLRAEESGTLSEVGKILEAEFKEPAPPNPDADPDDPSK